jgi:mRNA-degrading endonuclease RelE of RelBE toxin-antitoxin system
MGNVTFEQEIIEQVRKLDAENQKRVLEFIRSLGQPSVTEEEWLEKAHALRLELRARYGEGFVFNSLSVLDEAREERLNDLMGDG